MSILFCLRKQGCAHLFKTRAEVFKSGLRSSSPLIYNTDRQTSSYSCDYTYNRGFAGACSPPIISANNYFTVLGESLNRVDVQILENCKVDFVLQFQKMIAVSACLEL